MDLDDDRLAPYRQLQSAGAGRAGAGRFVVEGALAVERLLASDLSVESIVCTPSQRARLAIPERRREVPVIELGKPELATLTGFDFHRGVLACAIRPPASERFDAAALADLRARPRLRIVVAERLADPRNLGALIRNLAAFGADALVADAHGADPFSRLAIRAGVGNVFRTPLLVSAELPGTVAALARELDAAVVAATPDPQAVELPQFAAPDRLILLVGNEGAGLSDALLAAADARVRIPIDPRSDSVNVAAAAAVLLYALSA